MMMAKFKVGDKIRSLERSSAISVGDIFTVKDCGKNIVQFDDRAGCLRRRDVYDYELVSTAEESEATSETPAPEVPTNTIPMMTEEAARLTSASYVSRYINNTYPTAKDLVFAVLQDLGLIIPKPETPLEQFARETGVTIDDSNRSAIEAALAWGR